MKTIYAREILDSRGNPTLETTVVLDNYMTGIASVPSGASKGTYEAAELRDGDRKRFLGLGVLQAKAHVDFIGEKLKGIDPSDQAQIDQMMITLDGTENKGKLGANSILSVSLAVAASAAKAQTLPLYEYIQKLSGTAHIASTITPLFNIINGGAHGSNDLSFQEFMVIPAQDFAFEKALQAGVELYHLLKVQLKKAGLHYAVGDEGGFSPELRSNDEALAMLQEVIKNSSYTLGSDVFLGLDIAATEFYSNNTYQVSAKEQLSASNYQNYLADLIKQYQLYSIEDPFAEQDWENWSRFTDEFGANLQIVGDDLLVTNKDRLQKAIDTKACNSILVKVNQIGTLTETLEVINLARKNHFKIIISHRSGETNDDFIADLAVGVDADFVKFGAPARGERVAKYNRLLAIYQNAYRKEA